MLRHNDNNIRRVEWEAHQTLPHELTSGEHTTPSPPGEAHQTLLTPAFLGRAHQTYPSGGGTPDYHHASFPGEDTPSGGDTPDPPLWGEAHETHPHQQTSQLSLFWSETHSFGANLTLSLQCLHFSLQCFHFSLHVAYFSLISYF